MTKKGYKQTKEHINNMIKAKIKNGTFNQKKTKIVRKKMSVSKLGIKNPMWKGDEVLYASLHEWIKNHKVKTQFCESCHKNKSYDLANISGEYRRDINDFEWLCRKCHMKKDGRLEKMYAGISKGEKNEKRN